MWPVVRLAAAARRHGSLREDDCKDLPVLSTPVPDVIDTARRLWKAEAAAHGPKASLRRVVFQVVREPFVRSAVLLTLRGTGNACVLPLLIDLIVSAVVRGDTDAAARFLAVLLAERVAGAVVEYWGFKLASTRVSTDLHAAVAGLIVDKASRPDLRGLKACGVDASALVGRELAMVHNGCSSMLPNGLIALPTLIAGCVTLFVLLGWSAIFGVAWVLLTVRIGLQVQEYGKIAEGKMAVAATKRLGALDNVVSAIKAIKYFAWEGEFLQSLLDARANECAHLRNRSRWTAIAIAVGKLTPVTGSLATFLAYALLGNELRAGTIFAANSVFMTLRFSVGAFSFLSQLWKTMSLTFSRVEKFLALAERPPCLPLEAASPSLAFASDLRIAFPGGSGDGADAAGGKAAEPNKLGKASPAPPPSGAGCGPGFELRVPGALPVGAPGKVTAVCGAVGSGKSVLLSALAGSVDGDALMTGSARAVKSVGWSPQKPLIISGTIRDNILLGRPPDEGRLERCLADACLGQDLEQWASGLDEMVGDRGTTLSGGQQARVGLARTLYHDPDLLLLDDPFAAVDAAVGRAMLQALRRRCSPLDQAVDLGVPCRAAAPGAIVVLNQLPLLPNCDQVVFIKAGVVTAVGTFDQVGRNADFAAFMTGIELQRRPLDSKQDKDAASEETARVARVSARRPSVEAQGFIQKESTATGFVRWAVWRSYLFAPGKLFAVGLAGLYVCMYLTLGARDWWMAVWADADGGDTAFHVALFVLFSVSHISVVGVSVLAIGSFAARAGQNLHLDCMTHLMRAPMAYFDRTPGGRITSRLGPDLGMVDNTLCIMIDVVATFGLMAFMMCLTVIIKIPQMAVIFALGFVTSAPVFHGLAILRQDTKRYSNHATAPLLSNLGDLRRGASLARSLGCQDFFLARHQEFAQAWCVYTDTCMFTTPLGQTWCHVVHFVVLTATGILTFTQSDGLLEDSGLVAMYFSYAALFGLFAMASLNASMSLLMNGASLERLVEFKLGDLPQEPAWTLPDDPSPEAWPCAGAVKFKGVCMRYRPQLPLALDHFDLSVEAREKIGIVGRTGAGKSTITSVLFRLVECEAGRVSIDGVDIAGLGLHTLRKAMSMIPQEPIVMNGTVRYNIDPFGRYGEKKLMACLETAGLSTVNLDTTVAGASAGLSAGQKQLLTFARTLLQDTRVVMMDEPTASVDMQTDRLVQQMSQKSLAGRTVITIAHRLDTVRHCDRLVVLDAGKLVEVGPPEQLLADPGSRLARLVAAEGGTRRKAAPLTAIARLVTCGAAPPCGDPRGRIRRPRE